MAEKLDKKNDSLFPFQTYTFKNTTELEMMRPSAFNLMLNPEHEHELWIGNINGLVSSTSEYGLAIKLKGYIIARKKLTFILPENYEAIRPDNGNIGFRKTVLDMIRLGETKGQITIYTYSIEHAEEDINKILKEFKETDMKFNVVCQNPPYDRNLHLKILEAIIPYAEKVVNISPVRWLQDPFAPYSTRSDYCKFENSISKKIESLNVISAKDASKLFDAAFTMNLGIYVCSDKGGYAYQHNDPLVTKIVEKTMESSWASFSQKKFYDEGCIQKKPYAMNITAYGGNNLVVNTTYESQVATELMCEKSVRTGGDGSASSHFEFNSEEERRNFYNVYIHPFMRWHTSLWKIDVHVKSYKVPYFNDYTHPWKLKDFFAWFDLTKEEQARVVREIRQMRHDKRQ